MNPDVGRGQKYKGKTDASTIPARLRDLGYESYADYLESAHWQAVRRRYKASDRPQRCGCGARPTCLHHLTYANLGAERLEDLLALCDDCHREAHGRRSRGRRRKGKRKRGTVKFDPSIIRPQVKPEQGYAAWSEAQLRGPRY